MIDFRFSDHDPCPETKINGTLFAESPKAMKWLEAHGKGLKIDETLTLAHSVDIDETVIYLSFLGFKCEPVEPVATLDEILDELDRWELETQTEI